MPSNLLLKKFRPSRYIAGITVIWGVIATLTGITQTYGELLACRILLGVFEAGLFPGFLTYLTLFYNKKELALRVGYLFVAAALAGAVGGLVAYGIGYMDGISGLRGWRWIMILEGIPSVILGICCWIFLPNDPDSAKFLTSDDRLFMIMRRERDVGQTASAQKFHWADVKEGALDWRVWTFCISQFGTDTMLYGFSTFLPTIISGMGKWTRPQAQALTVPVYSVGAASYLAVAWLSDRTQQRGLYSCIFAVVSIIGYGLLMSPAGAAVHYTGCFLVAVGLYIAVGLPLAWLPTNLPRYGKRTFATGLQLTLGNISGIMAPFLYPTLEGPRFLMGHGVTLALVGWAGINFAIMSLYYIRENKTRASGQRDSSVEGKTEAEINEMGDRNPRFMFTY